VIWALENKTGRLSRNVGHQLFSDAMRHRRTGSTTTPLRKPKTSEYFCV